MHIVVRSGWPVRAQRGGAVRDGRGPLGRVHAAPTPVPKAHQVMLLVVPEIAGEAAHVAPHDASPLDNPRVALLHLAEEVVVVLHQRLVYVVPGDGEGVQEVRLLAEADGKECGLARGRAPGLARLGRDEDIVGVAAPLAARLKDGAVALQGRLVELEGNDPPILLVIYPEEGGHEEGWLAQTGLVDGGIVARLGLGLGQRLNPNASRHHLRGGRHFAFSPAASPASTTARKAFCFTVRRAQRPEGVCISAAIFASMRPNCSCVRCAHSGGRLPSDLAKCFSRNLRIVSRSSAGAEVRYLITFGFQTRKDQISAFVTLSGGPITSSVPSTTT